MRTLVASLGVLKDPIMMTYLVQRPRMPPQRLCLMVVLSVLQQHWQLVLLVVLQESARSGQFGGGPLRLPSLFAKRCQNTAEIWRRLFESLSRARGNVSI